MKTPFAKKALLTLSASALMMTSAMPLAQAHDDNYNNNRYYGNSRYEQHPYLKKAAIGGLGGAVLGGVLANDGSRGNGAVKGALLGAGVGLGYEYLKQKGYISGIGNW
ncbi:MAG: hypothetical protein VKJ04_10160 [Vampirovibrionales bacterium]|nr:hypothetical protein [Vampirovibrionales bacterium]